MSRLKGYETNNCNLFLFSPFYLKDVQSNSFFKKFGKEGESGVLNSEQEV